MIIIVIAISFISALGWYFVPLKYRSLIIVGSILTTDAVVYSIGSSHMTNKDVLIVSLIAGIVSVVVMLFLDKIVKGSER